MNSFERLEMFRLLGLRKIVRVEIGFCGGNDEGDIESFVATTADGTEVEIADTYQSIQWGGGDPVVSYINAKTGEKIKEGDVLHEDAVIRQLCLAPIEAKYGGFAGEYYVNGTLTIDVEEQTIVMSGTESIPTDFDVYEEY